MFIKKLLTTTSALAFVAGANSTALGTTLTSQVNPSSFNASGNWDPAQIVTTGDSLVMGGLDRINANLDDIYITDISGSNIMREIVAINTGLVVGNITSSAPSPGSNGNININAGMDVTLVGGDSASRTTAANYSGLNGLDFSGAGAILTIDTSAVLAHPIDGSSAGAGDAIDFNGSVSNGSNGTLNIKTDLNTYNKQWFTIGTINIGTASKAANFASDLGKSKIIVIIEGVNFLHPDSGYSIDSVTNARLIGPLGGDTDVYGHVSIITRDDTGTGGFNNSGDGTLGVSNTQRLKSLTLEGTKRIAINVPIYSKNIIGGMFVSDEEIYLKQLVDCGENSSFTFNNDSSKLVTFFKDTTITTIDLGGISRAINVATNATLTANIVGDLSDATKVTGTLTLEGNTGFVGTVTNLSKIIGGERFRGATLGAGNHTVTEIQIIGTIGTIKFADGANVKIDGAGNGGAINSTGGAAGILNFLGSSTVEGTIGANTAPENINANGDANSTVTFNSAAAATTLTIGAGTVELGDNFTGAIEAADNGVGTLSLTGNGTITGTIGSDDALATINLQATNTFNSAVSATNLSLDGGAATFDDDITGDVTSTENGGTLTAANITGNVDLSNGGTLSSATKITGNLTVASDGAVTTVGAITGNATVSNTATVNATDIVGGNLAVSGSALFTGGANTNVTGTVIINSDNANANTLNNATDAVTLTAGKLTMNDAADDVTLTTGTLIMNDATGNASTVSIAAGTLTIGNAANDLTVTGGTVASANSVSGNMAVSNAAVITTVGAVTGNVTLSGTSTATSTSTVGGNLAVSGSTLFTGGANTNVTGTVIINSDNESANTLNNATGAVTLTAGKLTMNDAADDVTLTTGTLIMNDATGVASTVSIAAGTLTIVNAANDLTVTGGTVTSADTVGGDLAASNAAVITTVGSVDGDVTLSDTAELSIANDIGGTLDTGANNTLTFTGAGTVTGAVNALGGMTIQADRTFSNANTALGDVSIEVSTTKITLTAGDLGAANITTNQTDSSNNIIVNATQTITGNIGTADNPLGSLVLNADITANINTTNFYAEVTTNTNNKGSVVFGADGISILNLGTENALLKSVTFDEDASITGDIYATTVNISNGKVATFKSSVNCSSLNLVGATAKAIFDEDLIVNSVVTSTAGGLVEFAGNSTINTDLGEDANHLTSVSFADDETKTAILSADIFADDIVINKGTLQLAKAAEITGDITTNAAILDIADNALTASGNMTLNGDNIVKFTITDSGFGSDLTGGTITINGDLTLAKGATLSIDPTDDRVFKSTTTTARTFSLFTLDGGRVTGNKNNITVTSSNDWNVAVKNNNIVLSEAVIIVTTNSAEERKLIVQKTISSINTIMTNKAERININTLEQTNSGAKIIDMLSTFDNNNNKKEETLDRIIKSSAASASIINNISEVSGTINTRSITLNAPTIKTASLANVTGVAAGDEDSRFGAWISPFYGKTNQESRNNSSGYTNESYGATLGFDTRTNSDWIIGAAITIAHANIKHKDLKLGDRTRVNSTLFSIYNMQNITDNWFALGTATLAINRVHNHSKRVASANSYELANAKYRANSFNLKQTLGYNYITDRAIFTPMLGIKFSRVNAVHYQESATTFQNLNIHTKALNKIEAIAGINALGSSYNISGIIINPEMHAFIDYNLLNKSSRPQISLDRNKLTSTSSKESRVNYSLGIGATVTHDSVEYRAGYDLHLSDKLVGHQGSIKIRISF